jgi:hypothetical protein
MYNFFPILGKRYFGKEIAMTIFAVRIFMLFVNYEKNTFLSDDGITGLLFDRADERWI